jgi:hypothetical protein
MHGEVIVYLTLYPMVSHNQADADIGSETHHDRSERPGGLYINNPGQHTNTVLKKNQ